MIVIKFRGKLKRINMKKILGQLSNPLIFIGLGVVLRLIPHIPNMAPIAAMALFGGVYLNKRYALFVPLVAMVLSDIVLGFSPVTPFVYGSFLLTGVIGLWVKSHKSIQYVLLASLLSSSLFFLVTNFGVWLVGGLYPHTMMGLQMCYTLALPFFRNTLIGDLFYTGVLFGSFACIKKLSNVVSLKITA